MAGVTTLSPTKVLAMYSMLLQSKSRLLCSKSIVSLLLEAQHVS